MRASSISFPSTIGFVVTGTRAFLTARSWTDVTVQPKLPAAKTAQMVTVRDDGGSERDGIERRRHSLNVWADGPVTAEDLARDVADCARSVLHATDISITEVEDDTDTALVVGETTLTHYLVAFTLAVRATNL